MLSVLSRQIAGRVGVYKSVCTVAIAATLLPLASKYYYSSDSNANMSAEPNSVYDFSYIDIDGVEQSLRRYEGRVLIVVNVASQCGYTKVNYEQLAEMYDKYKDKGLSVLGFPCDQFMGQEPGDEAQIKEFVCTRFKANFDMAKKINVNGKDTHPLWVYLKKKQGGTLLDAIKWNFTKFVINKKGEVVSRHGPSTNPKEFEAEVEKLLNE